MALSQPAHGAHGEPLVARMTSIRSASIRCRTLLGNNIDFAKIRADSSDRAPDRRDRDRHRPRPAVPAATSSRVEARARLRSVLPTLHRTVEIDGVGYWDGGFSANPDLVTLASESPVQDTLLVQITPLVKQGLPTGVREIAGFVNRLTFNAPLLRDIEVIEMAREGARGAPALAASAAASAPLVAHRFHLVEAGRYTASLSDESKMKPDLGLLTYLHGAGRTQMHKWLAQEPPRHRQAVERGPQSALPRRFSPNAPDDETGEQPKDAQPRAASSGNAKVATSTS